MALSECYYGKPNCLGNFLTQIPLLWWLLNEVTSDCGKETCPRRKAGYPRRLVADVGHCFRRVLHSVLSTFPVLSAVLWSKKKKSGSFLVVSPFQFVLSKHILY